MLKPQTCSFISSVICGGREEYGETKIIVLHLQLVLSLRLTVADATVWIHNVP